MKHSWLMAAFVSIWLHSAATAQTPDADSSANAEAGLDTSLRTKAYEMPVTTLDGTAMETSASHMLLMDADTGAVLAEKAADATMYPSSMTKMMTLYIAFKEMKEGRLKLDQTFTVSERAWRMQGSKMFVPLGEQVSVENLIRGIAIQSGNDACIVLAEGLAGSEEAFANRMNETAKALGMQHTHFTDSTGWPHPDHTTTPRDLAILAKALMNDFPEYHRYHSEREFTYHGIRQFNRNRLLERTDLGVDGIKTGHTDAAGYGITLSTKDAHTGRRLILVINGLASEAARAMEGERLLVWGLRNFKNISVAEPGQILRHGKLWSGVKDTAGLTVKAPLLATVPVQTKLAEIRLVSTYQAPLKAPLMQGQEVGSISAKLPSGASMDGVLVAAESVEKRGVLGRLLSVVGL